uniref:Uncharacterized protein n=1 Tax=Anguilla anguilla TaxID=7936 RepID=A0A0E9XB08_ANGAN
MSKRCFTRGHVS